MPTRIMNMQDALKVIGALTAEKPASYYVATTPADVMLHRTSEGRVTRTVSVNQQQTQTETDDYTAARALYSDRRFYNATQRAQSRQE